MARSGEHAQRVLYLVTDGVYCPAFQSQVLVEVKALRQRGLDARLVVWTPRRQLGRNRPGAEDRPEWMRVLPRGLWMGRVSAWRCLRELRAILRQWEWLGQPLICYARSAMAGAIGLALRRCSPHVKAVTDFRAILYDEYRLAVRAMPWPKRILAKAALREIRIQETQCARRSDAVRCISHVCKRVLVERFGADERLITVVPCYVDTRRFRYDGQARRAVRRQLGIPDEALVVVFNGSLGKEYADHPQQVLEAYGRLSRLRASRLLLITLQPEVAKAAVAGSPISPREVSVLSGSPDQVARWSQAGDLGLIVRQRNEAWQVCCPIKLGEYLRCGMKVLATPGLGDVAEILARLDGGWVVDLPDEPLPDRVAEPYGDPVRSALSEAAGRELGHEVHLDRILSLYSQLGGL